VTEVFVVEHFREQNYFYCSRYTCVCL